jgi:hypothetical protein
MTLGAGGAAARADALIRRARKNIKRTITIAKPKSGGL